MPDTTAPVITLNGDAEITLTLGSAYTELGAVADDGSTVNITGSVDVNTLGDYVLTYNATDAAGNVATPVTRTIHIVPVPDTTAPVITLNGDAEITLTLGSAYTELGAVADDGSTVNITGSVDVNTLGDYVLTYNATDAAGNVATPVTRTIHIVPVPDTTAPVITLNGDAEITLTLGSAYTELGAVADDGSTVNITGSVDVNTLGDYVLTYNATDAAGNVATPVTRTIHIVPVPDTTAPVITLNGDAEITLTLGSAYTELGAVADDGSTVNITGSVDANTLGDYVLTYNATDAAGNVATPVTRTIHVSLAPAHLATITIDPLTVALTVGGTSQLTATTLDQYGQPFVATVIWASDNAAATVSDTGLVTAVSVGSANITASSGEITSAAPSVITVTLM